MTMPNPADLLRLSIVIPAYNEADRLPPYLSAITKYVEYRALSAEILIVGDGSTDSTATVVQRLSTDTPLIHLLRLQRNLGKGAAVRAGVLAAKGELVLIADADGATPIAEIERLQAELANGADIAIGSRYLASRDARYHVRARWHRSVLGDIFNTLIQLLGLRGITDTQCGFKLLRQDLAKDLFGLGRIDRYGFDLEMLYIAQHRRYRIREVPINWADQPGSKVRVFWDGLQMLADMVRVRRNHARGLYNPRPVAPSAVSA